MADLVDNSVAAGATRVNIETHFEPQASYALISDDGSGMTESELLESLRFGSRREYDRNELGRFGLGLKTGSFSQCRRLTVVTRHSLKQERISARTLDLSVIERLDQWVVSANESTPAIERARSILSEGPGTVVVWEDLDRVLPERYAESGWGRRRLNNLAKKTSIHLGMVFHRFIEGVPGRPELVLAVNGEKVTPWNPFAVDQPGTVEFRTKTFDVETSEGFAEVCYRGYVLPARDQFTSPDEFERLSGPLKWNRQQGLYVYRANRLVHFGGWSGIRGIDEHTKLARASLDFDTDLDAAFQINVAKMRVSLPPALKPRLEKQVHDLCMAADDAYRKAAKKSGAGVGPTPRSVASGAAAQADVLVALRAAVLETTELAAFNAAFDVLKRRHPKLASELGL
jgi:hypothetical protein